MRRRHQAFTFEPIGILRSCFTGKFGIPRQPGLVTSALARLEVFPAYAREEAFSGLEGFSHLWLIFVFHDCLGEGWKPTVRPPRLGGRRKVGVFASRAPYRPNPIGISAVEFVSLERNGQELTLHLRGVDVLDGTPILDVKPYVPYADVVSDPRAGFAKEAPGAAWTVDFTDEARQQLLAADPRGVRELEPLIAQILRQDPRPGYLDRYPERTDFGMRIYDLEVQWRLQGHRALVTAVLPTRTEK